MPNFASWNQAGVGRVSTESHVGWYGCAERAAAAPNRARVRTWIFMESLSFAGADCIVGDA